MHGSVAGDAIQEGALGANLHVFQPARRDDEGSLDLVGEIGCGNACGLERARDEAAVFVDHRTYARLRLYRRGPSLLTRPW